MSRAALLAVVLALASCEHGIDLTGKVTVPATILRTFSTEHPGELLVSVTNLAQSAAFTILDQALCAPADRDLVVEIQRFTFGCAVPGAAEVSASVFAGGREELSCDGSAPGAPPYPDPRPIVASGRAQAPMNVYGDWMACKNGGASFWVHVAR